MSRSRRTYPTQHMQKRAGDSGTYRADYTAELLSGVTISSVSHDSTTPSGLTIASPAPNAAAFQPRYSDDTADEVAIGKGFTFTMSGGTAGTQYKLIFLLTLSSGDTDEAPVIVDCED